MTRKVEKTLAKIPVVNLLVRWLKKIKFASHMGLSVYDILEMYIIGIVKGALSTRASAIAYSFFMALFPFLLFIITLLPFIEIKDFQTEFLAFIESMIPASLDNFFSEIFEDILNKRRGGLLSSTFILSIFLMANGVNSLFGGFESSYHVKVNRNLFRQYLVALGIGLLLTVFLLILVIFFTWFEIYVVQYVSDFADKEYHIDYLKGDELGVKVSRFLFLVFMIYVSSSVLYYFGTSKAKGRFFSPGALMSTILILLTTWLFGVYIDNFSQYNELYGSIGTLLILMLYIWLNANILLLGFELNAALYRLKQNIKKTEPSG